MSELTRAIIQQKLKSRLPQSHKGDHGHVLLVAGSRGSMGAATIAARACLRSGAGLLTVCAPESERAILQASIPEAMVVMRGITAPDLARYTAVGIGPGVGTGEQEKHFLADLLTRFQKPILLDADALNIIALNRELLHAIPKGSILTPHPKEFDRLFGHHDTGEQRTATALQMAEALGLVLVVKGQHTEVVFGGDIVTNTSGNAGLAKGGSGDALTGMISAFLAQGYDVFDAAQCGVYLHGLAADIALEKQSLESLLITDVIECIGQAFNCIRAQT
ncbi:MAG TPA: NAD(P)H-hydrate dehydratase [Flavisolibacter sp.]|jgi:NAD(P)H-hydrate epimerase